MRGTVETAEGMFEDIYDAYVDFENKFGKGMGILGDIIRDDFIRQLEDARDAIDNLDYMASNRLPEYDSDYQPHEDEYWDEPDDYYGNDYDNKNNDEDYKNHRLYKEFINYANMSIEDLKDMFQLAQRVLDDKDNPPNDIAREYYLDIAEAANRFANLKRGLGFMVTANKFFEARGRRISKGYKTGGETSKTGLHWLDGEDGEPERILSAQQTKDFKDRKSVV